MQVEHDPSRKRKAVNDKMSFKGAQSSAKHGVSQFQQVFSVGAAQIRESLNELIAQVDHFGQDLLQNPCEAVLIRYTQAVRHFIRKAQGQAFAVERNFDRHNRLYTLVREVDTKIAQLTDQILSGQWKSLEVAARLQEIRGILLDMYI